MLNVPSLSQMLSVIGVALFATVVLTVIAGSLLSRIQTAAKAMTPAPQIPAQRKSNHKSPVASR
jgi:hypothetical protein